jgi:AraC family transcriptional regulator, transcriptional activator FtrA
MFVTETCRTGGNLYSGGNANVRSKSDKMSSAQNTRGKSAIPPLVCLLAYDGLCTFEFGIGVEVFGLPRPEFKDWYQFCVVASERGALRATGGITIKADKDISVLKKADLILIPGWKSPDAPVDKKLLKAIRSAHARGSTIASICSGVFVLAEAGLLDGKRATTHWRYAEQLKARYPKINVDPEVIFVDEGQVMTSAGSAAGLDLCLHIVRRDFGAERANAVARRLVLPAHRDGGQLQFVPRPVPKLRGGRISPMLDIVRQHLSEEWPVQKMAQVAGLSERTLARKMIESTGKSPLVWLKNERVASASGLLETTTAVLDDIAMACGFGSMETFRRCFRELTGTTPSAYKRSFGPLVDEPS